MERNRRVERARDALTRALCQLVDGAWTEDGLATAIFFASLAVVHLAAADVGERSRDRLLRTLEAERERRARGPEV